MQLAGKDKMVPLSPEIGCFYSIDASNLNFQMLKAFATILCFCLLAWNTASAQNKLGHVNTGLVLESLVVTAEADSMLQLYQDSLQAGFLLLQDEFNEKYKYGSENKENLTPKQIAQLQEQLQDLQQQIEIFEREGARMFEQRRAQYLTPIVDNVMATIRAYAKTNGYQFIFDSSLPQAMLFAQEGADLTPNIIAELKD